MKLSKTSEWTIRKECALELPKISVLCSKQSREQVLTPVMEELLTDANKWVHTAAADQLGIYIATFAEPEILTLAIHQEGELYVVNVADDNENYKDMLSEEKLKNYQFYEDMFAETLIPTGADLGRTFGGIPMSTLFSSSSSAYPDSSSSGACMGNSSKTIICDSAWYNSMSPSNPFAPDSADRLEEEPKQSTQLPSSKSTGLGDEKRSEKVEVDNPYQKFVHPNFLINLSSFIMNTTASSPTSSTGSGTPPSPGTNQFHSLPPLLNTKLDSSSGSLAGQRDYDFKNMYDKTSQKNDNTSSNKANSPDESGISLDTNGNDVASAEKSVSADDVVNNNESPVSSTEDERPLDNNKLDVMDDASNNNNKSNNASAEEPMESSQLEQELAKLSLTVGDDEEDVNRTSAHLKRATPEGLPNVIKMAIKDKKKSGKKGGLKGLTLPAMPLPQEKEGGETKATPDDDHEDNKNNNAADEEDPSPPQTPSIEDAPTSCPFGGGEKDDETVKTPETARIMDTEKEVDIFAAAGDGNAKNVRPPPATDDEQEFYSNNYWYVKPPELTVDELVWIENRVKAQEEQEKKRAEEEQKRQADEEELQKSLPPPPPAENYFDNDEMEEDLPEPMEKRRLFSLYSMKYKSYKLGEGKHLNLKPERLLK